MMLLFHLGNAWNLMSAPAPVQHRGYFMGLVKQVKMQLQLWPDSLGKPAFQWCQKNLICPSALIPWNLNRLKLQQGKTNSKQHPRLVLPIEDVLPHAELFCSQASEMWMDSQTCVRAQCWDYFSRTEKIELCTAFSVHLKQAVISLLHYWIPLHFFKANECSFGCGWQEIYG